MLASGLVDHEAVCGSRKRHQSSSSWNDEVLGINLFAHNATSLAWAHSLIVINNTVSHHVTHKSLYVIPLSQNNKFYLKLRSLLWKILLDYKESFPTQWEHTLNSLPLQSN